MDELGCKEPGLADDPSGLTRQLTKKRRAAEEISSAALAQPL